MREAPAVSVIINTLNRAKYLENTLRALRHLDYPEFEVIVVNGPSNDGTEALLDRWSRSIKRLRCPEPNLSMSRNIGIRAAAGDVVAFIDDDGVPDSMWLKRLTPAYDDPSVGGAGGYVFNHTGVEYQGKVVVHDLVGNYLKFDSFPELSGLCFPGTRRFPGLIGVNSSFRRSALLEVGGFDELYAYFLDETDVCARLVNRGYTIRSMETSLVYHKGAPSGQRNYFLMTRSQAYFARRHAAPVLGIEQADAFMGQVVAGYRATIDLQRARGGLTPEQAAAVESGIMNGLAEGRSRAAESPRLIGAVQKPAPFVSFEKISPEGSGRRMRVCLLSQEYPPQICGGIGRWTHALARGLAARGHDVHVLTPARNAPPTVDYEDDVWVHRYRVTDRHKGIELADVPLPVWVRCMNLSALAELRRIRDDIHPVDVVLTPIWDVEGLAALQSEEFKTVTSLQTSYKISRGDHPEWEIDDAFRSGHVEPVIAAEQRLLERSPRVLSISNAMVGIVKDLYGVDLARKHLAVIPLGLPDRRTEVTVPEPGNELRILFVGRHELRKGIDVLLDAIPELCMEFPNVRFVLAGNCTLPEARSGLSFKELFQRRHRTQEWLSRVEFPGMLPDDLLVKEYARCDLFVAPSRFESFGLVYLEAMMFGKPVIGTTAGGIPEVVTEGVTGRTVPPGDAVSLASALRELMTDAARRAEMGRRARADYEARFSDVAMARATERYFAEIAGREEVRTT